MIYWCGCKTNTTPEGVRYFIKKCETSGKTATTSYNPSHYTWILINHPTPITQNKVRGEKKMIRNNQFVRMQDEKEAIHFIKVCKQHKANKGNAWIAIQHREK